MYSISELRQSVYELGRGLRRPEDLVLRWRDRATRSAPPMLIFPVLLLGAILGLAVYGLTMHMHQGVLGMLRGAFFAPLAAGTGWTLALPALYIINSSLGSRLDFSTTLLAALATVSFGSLAMLASVPVTWFFGLMLPYQDLRILVNFVVFTGVGICMTDVFVRVMRALDPERQSRFAYLWLGLVGTIGGEFFLLLGVFNL